jgi:hypothetical protein
MRVKAIFICRQCLAEVVREYEVADPKFFLKAVLAGAVVDPPVLETERMLEKDISKQTAAPVDLTHECGENCLGVLKPQTVLTYNEE